VFLPAPLLSVSLPLPPCMLSFPSPPNAYIGDVPASPMIVSSPAPASRLTWVILGVSSVAEIR
jgi:hypothetical protein